MTIQELENMAAHGFKLDEESGPNEAEFIACIEIINKASELAGEIKKTDRWDKESIKSKLASIVWFSARLAGVYGINLDESLRNRAEQEKPSPSPQNQPKTGNPAGRKFYLPRQKPKFRNTKENK